MKLGTRTEIVFVPDLERMILILFKSKQLYYNPISVPVPNPKAVRVTKVKAVRVTHLQTTTRKTAKRQPWRFSPFHSLNLQIIFLQQPSAKQGIHQSDSGFCSFILFVDQRIDLDELGAGHNACLGDQLEGEVGLAV